MRDLPWHYISGLRNPVSMHSYLELSQATTYWNVAISPQNSTRSDDWSLLTYASRGGPHTMLLPFWNPSLPSRSCFPSFKALIPFLIEGAVFLPRWKSKTLKKLLSFFLPHWGSCFLPTRKSKTLKKLFLSSFLIERAVFFPTRKNKTSKKLFTLFLPC